MKKIIYIALATLFLIGCQDQINPDLINPNDPGSRTFQVTASVDGENDEPETRVTLTPNGMGMSLAWEVGDTIALLFRQTILGQETVRVKSSTTIKSISHNGKKGTFDIVVPTAISLDSPFDLYGVYGGGGLDETNPNRAIFTVNKGGTLDKIEQQKEVMLVFRKENITNLNQALLVNFRHIGHLFCLKLKNEGTQTLNLKSVYLQSYVPNAESLDLKRWVISGAGQYYDLETQEYSSGVTRTDILSFAMPEGGIAPGDSCMLYAWCKAVMSDKEGRKNSDGFIIYHPVVPQLQLVIERQSGKKWTTYAKTPRKESAPQIGRCFHFVASVTNTAVHFDFGDLTKPDKTMTGLSLKGDLLFACGTREGWSLRANADINGPSSICVIYSRSDSLFYNEARDGTGYGIYDPSYYYPDRFEANWGTEFFLGKGLTDVCIADGCSHRDIHIVYVTPEGKIGYRRKYPNWTQESLIESQGGGVCSKPEIVIAEGKNNSERYIVYTDSKVEVAQNEYAKGIMVNTPGYPYTTQLLVESRTEQPGGGYIEERYPQGARITAGRIGHYNPNNPGGNVNRFFLNYITLRERITVSGEQVIENSEYDIIITTKKMDSSDPRESSITIPVTGSDYIFDITSRDLSQLTYAAAYTKNNVLQMRYFRTDYMEYYPQPTIDLLNLYEDAFPSVQLSNTSERPAFLSYAPNNICTGLAGIDTDGNLINISSHFTDDDSYVKSDQFIHNTSKQVKPGTVATSVDFANWHIYSVYTDLDGYIRIDYIDSANRKGWQ